MRRPQEYEETSKLFLNLLKANVKKSLGFRYISVAFSEYMNFKLPVIQSKRIMGPK